MKAKHAAPEALQPPWRLTGVLLTLAVDGGHVAGVLLSHPTSPRLLLKITPWFWFGHALAVTTCAAAFLFGGCESVIASLGMVAAIFGTVVFQDPNYDAAPWSGLASDALYMALLFILALRSRRWWTMWAAAFQLLLVLIDLVRFIDPDFRTLAYASSVALLTWAVLLAIGAGVLSERRSRATAADLGASAEERERGALS